MRDHTAVPNLRRLLGFDAAAGTNSLSRAAQMMRLSQPALTHSIAQLEGELGARLFERSPEGVFLNDAGHIFHKRATRFFEQLRSALAGAAGCGAEDAAVELQVSKLATAQVRA